MKKIFAILIIIFTMLSVCSCRTGEKKYKHIYGCPTRYVTNVVEAKFIDVDGDRNYRFELLNNIVGAGVEQEFDAYVIVRGNNEYQSVLYPSGTPIVSSLPPRLCSGEIYILCLSQDKNAYRIDCIWVDNID